MKRIHYRGLSGKYIIDKMHTRLIDNNEPESASEDSVPEYRIYSAQDVVNEILPNHGGFVHFLGRKALKYKAFICKVPFLYQCALKCKTRLVQETQIPKDLCGLFVYEQKPFIIACYREILNREPDTEGFLAYQASLCRGMPKEAVVEAFLSSDEFQNRFLVKDRKTYQKSYRTYKFKNSLKKVPVLGYLISWIQLPKRMEQLGYEYRVTEWNRRTVFEDCYYFNSEILTSLSEKVDVILKERIFLETITNKLHLMEDKLNQIEDTVTSFARLQHLLQTEMGTFVSDFKDTSGALVGLHKEVLTSISDLHSVQDEMLTAVNNDAARAHQKYTTEVLVNLSEKADFLGTQVRTIESRLGELRAKSKSVFASYPGGILAVQTEYFIMGLPSEEWRLAAYISQNGYFERGSEILFRKIAKSTDTVIDVGANLGIYTLHAASLGCRVVSFEPTLNTFRLLNENIRVNGFFESGRIQTRNFAVGETEKEAQISIVSGISGWNNLFDSDETEDKQPIRVVALDHQFAPNSKIDIVKIDVEGGELYVLQGMKRILSENTHIKLLMEFAPAHLRRAGTEPATLLEEIRSHGLTIQAINEENGETEFKTDEELIDSQSINLYLSRFE